MGHLPFRIRMPLRHPRPPPVDASDGVEQGLMSRFARLVASCVLLGVALLVLQFRSAGEAVPLRKSLDTFPVAVGDWHVQTAASLDPEVITLLKVNDSVLQRYVDGGGRGVWLYVAYWATQRKGGAQIQSPQNCLPGSGGEPAEGSKP